MSSVGAEAQSVQLTVEKRSKTGRRDSNQDVAIRVEVIPGRVYIAGVADGMGGYAGGEQASATALKHVQRFGESLHGQLPEENLAALVYIRERIEGLYADIQQEIQSLSTTDPNLANMGTTMVLAVVCGRYFFIANIGDSRAYLLYRDSQGKLLFRQVSEDHTVFNDARRAGERIALETPQAQKLGKALTRALRPNTPSRPELFPGEGEPSPCFIGNDGDTLLLSSDGMYGSVSEQEVEKILCESSTLAQALEKLEEKAYGYESQDNITTVAVDFGPRDPKRRAARTVIAVTDTLLQSNYAPPAITPQPMPSAAYSADPTAMPLPELPRQKQRSGVPPAILIGGGLAVLAGIIGVVAAVVKPGGKPTLPSPLPSVVAPLPSPESSPEATESITDTETKPTTTKRKNDPRKDESELEKGSRTPTELPRRKSDLTRPVEQEPNRSADRPAEPRRIRPVAPRRTLERSSAAKPMPAVPQPAPKPAARGSVSQPKEIPDVGGGLADRVREGSRKVPNTPKPEATPKSGSEEEGKKSGGQPRDL